MSSFAQKTILSTADVARLFNVTETTVKRWADGGTLKCQKTPGGHRKFEIRNVVAFAQENKFEPVGALAIPDGDTLGQRIQVAMLGRDFSELVSAYVEKALSPDRTDLFLFLSYVYQHCVQLWEIHDLVVQPGMAEIGNRWERGEIGVNHEHRASYETLDALAKLQTQILIKPPVGRSVVFASPGEELHEIGLRCASYLFESEGWTTVYLGARIPSADLLSAIREMKPDVVCLSSTRGSPGSPSEDEIREVAEAAAKVRAQIVLGGLNAPAMRAALGPAHTFVRSSRELLAYIEKFDKPARPAT